MAAPNAVFVLLSDTHFGSSLLDQSQLPPLEVWRLIERARLGDRLDQSVRDHCKPHDLDTVRLLRYYLDFLFILLRDDGYSRDDFDLYLFLGDHVTWPLGASFRLFRDYVNRDKCTSGDGSVQITCRGLNIRADRLLMIPGNHDKLFQPDLNIYHRLLSEELKLPTEPSKKMAFVNCRRFGNREFVFISIDANDYCETANAVDSSIRSHLARGTVTEGLREQVHRSVRSLHDGGTVDGCSVTDYVAATKILLVHYAPDLIRATDGRWTGSLLPHECTGLSDLIDSLAGQLDLVLHGHLHSPNVYRLGGVPVISIGSASQVDCPNKGFFVLKFFEGPDIRVEHHLWNGRGFVADPDDARTRHLG